MTETAIEVEDLRFEWITGEPVLDIPSFVVARGERVFLQGPSGSGKSTLLGLIGAVLVPRKGSVRVLGTDVGTLPSAARDRFRADHIGFVFQMFNLLPYLGVLENVVLPTRFSARRRERAGDVVAEARRLLDALGIGDPGLLSRDVGRLSIGQQQRVAVARALLGRPDVLIADEPTSALDAGTREAFLELLMGECRAAGTTLLFVSHDTALGALFDRSLGLGSVNHAGRARQAA